MNRSLASGHVLHWRCGLWIALVTVPLGLSGWRPIAPPPSAITGVVFVDHNSNGQRDAQEPGVAEVAVSDQVNVVTTDPAGRYELTRRSTGGLVFVSVPNGYKATHGQWRALKPGHETHHVDFPLRIDPPRRSFRFMHASDTHVSESSVERMRLLRELVDSLRPAFLLMTGDLVRDALRVGEEEARRYYELYLSEIERFSAPVWNVPGNHENFGIERHQSLVSREHPLYGKGMFRHYLGPNYYSFTYSGVHFVGLDSVDYDDLWYYGHIDSTQVAWLKRDLSTVPAGTPIVTFNHIPFFSGILSVSGYNDTSVAPTLIRIGGVTQFRHTVSNAYELISLLTARHDYTLALGGHVHAREKLVYDVDGTNVRYYQSAAVIGPSGRPGMRMTSGVTLYRVEDGQIDDGEFIPLDTPMQH